MRKPLIELLATDKRFAESAQEGDADCVCSRCGGWIPESTIALRCWPEDGVYEYRFCDYCTEKDMGMMSFDHDHEPDAFGVCKECQYPLVKKNGQWRIAGPARFPGLVQ